MPADEPKLRWIARARGGILQHAGPVMRLGVLSGTFNPPTRAHSQLAETAAWQLALDEVLFVLPEIPPHRSELAAGLADREEMLRRAVAGEPRFSAAVSSHGLLVEIHCALAAHYPPATRAFFLLGRDAAERILVRWPYANREEALVQMFTRFEIAVAERNGRFEIPADDAAARFAGKIHSLTLPSRWDLVSATRVRERVARAESIEDALAPEVAAYVSARGLYLCAPGKS
ncbi:MAG TPA: nicotinate-nicotinamide nucleotide adenylyltransferase [Candidatus Acidoferrum sp.]|nr:nicotinate-nicotinamide nucleotide adenylyltransferase [Candidatus Acidoferrum sp.]